MIVAAIITISMQDTVASSYSRGLKSAATHIQLDEPTLPPFAHTRFCLQFPADCEIRGTAFGGGQVEMTPARLQQLLDVNGTVNRSIQPERKAPSVVAARWQIEPQRGDCNDYAITKRHELLDLGWPSSALLLAEVVTRWGEHHLVLVVRTNVGDLVADNLSPHILAWSAAPYRWVRIQSPRDPGFWFRVAATQIVQAERHARGAASVARAVPSRNPVMTARSRQSAMGPDASPNVPQQSGRAARDDHKKREIWTWLLHSRSGSHVRAPERAVG
jgi:predicted transglutaminase-like cysteine proteinase